MKKKIALLRIIGIATFLIFLFSVYSKSTQASFTEFGKFTVVERVLIITSLASFAIIMALQVYRFYIINYYKEDNEEIDS